MPVITGAVEDLDGGIDLRVIDQGKEEHVGEDGEAVVAAAGGLGGDRERVEDGYCGVGTGTGEVVEFRANFGVELVGSEGEDEAAVEMEFEGYVIVALGPAGET